MGLNQTQETMQKRDSGANSPRCLILQLFQIIAKHAHPILDHHEGMGVETADDLAEDHASGSYNPLIYRFSLAEGKLTEEARGALVLSLDHSIRLMAAAFELGDFGVWSNVIRSVVYEGLFRVGGAVLEGKFHANEVPWFAGDEDKEPL